MTLALNGYKPIGIKAGDQTVQADLSDADNGIVAFTLKGSKNAEVEWSVTFKRK
ncbi:MAG: hypothetical protein KJO79_07115 [Verrucomicrobiae bacterium]|nr:hypothetical protein [Verrucomicrobiae bacterium]NNJ86931.1 hypothetical protein [Akkermansiaceae bacterium]